MEKINFTSLEAAMARDWLNALVLAHTRMKGLAVFNKQLSAQVSDFIHLEGRVDFLADLLGLELKEDSCLSKYYYYFTYDEVTFMTAQEERLEKYAGKADKGLSDGQVPADAGTVQRGLPAEGMGQGKVPL